MYKEIGLIRNLVHISSLCSTANTGYLSLNHAIKICCTYKYGPLTCIVALFCREEKEKKKLPRREREKKAVNCPQ